MCGASSFRAIAHNTTRVIDADWESFVGQSIQLDLGSIEFVEPFGLVYLYTFLNHLHDLGVVSISVRTEGSLTWACSTSELDRCPMRPYGERAPAIRCWHRVEAPYLNASGGTSAKQS